MGSVRGVRSVYRVVSVSLKGPRGINEMSFKRHFLRGEKVSILHRLGATLGLGLLGVGRLVLN